MSQATIMGEVRSLGHDAQARRNSDMVVQVHGSNHDGEQRVGVVLRKRAQAHTHVGERHDADEPHDDQV